MIDAQSHVIFEAYDKVSLTEFVPELAFEFSDLSEEAIPHYILRAITRMANMGNILRRTAIIHTQSCVDNYLLEPPDCMDVVAIMGICQIDGSRCGNVERLTHEPCRLSCGATSWFEYPNTIFIRTNGCFNIYRVTMSVAPRFDACEVDKMLLTKYYDTILAGAKSYIYAMTDKPWSSVGRAQEFKQEFERGVRGAAIDTMMGGQRGVIRIRGAGHL